MKQAVRSRGTALTSKEIELSTQNRAINSKANFVTGKQWQLITAMLVASSGELLTDFIRGTNYY